MKAIWAEAGPYTEVSGPEHKTIDGVHCTIYSEPTYSEESSLIPKIIEKYYIFQKNGRTFSIICGNSYSWVAEYIIKSIKPK